MKPVFYSSLLVFVLSTGAIASDIRSELRFFTEGMSKENCVSNMSRISDILDNVSKDLYDTEVKSSGHAPLLDELFEYKLTIHNKLRSFYANGGIEKDCSSATRSALRAIRTTEDYVSANLYQLNKETTTFSNNSFDEGNPHVRRNPEFRDFNLRSDLKSGDVLLTRGNAYTSAAIASLGEYDTQFSHMSMVYKDKEGKLWTVEAHIEVGSFVRPLQDHIDDKNFRTMVFRFDDEALAAKAAEYIFNKVKKASDTTGNILYDFGFDQDENNSLFCSEIVSYALSHVSNGAVQVPLFRSRLMDRKPRFVQMLGITSEASFVPADIEVDPRFRVISEWRDPSRVFDSLQKDAVLHAMYKWNDKYGYNMKQGSSKKAFLYRNIAWPLRRVPFLKKYFVEKMPLNMSRELIGYFGVLESVGELLQKKLKEVDDKAVLETGFPMLKTEKESFLEEVRIEDMQARKKKLHKMYRPATK